MTTIKTLAGFKFGDLNPLRVSENKALEDNIDIERMSPMGILGKLVEKAGKENILENVGYLKAIVLRKETESKDVGFFGKMFPDSNKNIIRFKARIPELHAALPIPSDVERNSDLDESKMDEEQLLKNKIIDMYPTFEGRFGVEKTPEPGSIVFVDFGDRNTMSDPIYIGPVSDGDYGIVGASSTTAVPKESVRAFSNIPKKMSYETLFGSEFEKNTNPMMKISRISPDVVKFGIKRGQRGYDIMVREDLESSVLEIKKHLTVLGSSLISRESLRPFSSVPSPNGGMIATSLHYTGLAIDLWPQIGCSSIGDPETEQYVVQYDPKEMKDGRPLFIVWARCEKEGAISQGANGTYTSEIMTIPALDISKSVGKGPPRIKNVRGCFVNLTQIFMDHGFKRISGRRQFYSLSVEETAEWWHFEYHPDDLQTNVTYGEVLSKIYKPPSEGRDGLPWNNKRKVWTGSFFK